MIAIDTNVIVYSADVTDALKHDSAKRLLLESAKSSDTVLLWQVAVEFLRWLRRSEDRGAISRTNAEVAFRELRDSFQLIPTNHRVLDIAVDIYRRHSLSHWDSMLLAACIDAGVDTLYTEDLSHGIVYDSVKVVNPFVP